MMSLFDHSGSRVAYDTSLLVLSSINVRNHTGLSDLSQLILESEESFSLVITVLLNLLVLSIKSNIDLFNVLQLVLKLLDLLFQLFVLLHGDLVVAAR